MKKITYITGNSRKFKNAKKFLKPYGIDVSQKEIEAPEIQADKAKDIAIYSSEYASKMLNKPVIKMDVSFHINSLNGFPGPYIKQINNWFSPQQIIELLLDKKDRSSYFIDIIAFSSPNKETKCLELITTGEISKKVSGENGWGIDKIFIPDGFNKTLASMTDNERQDVWKTKHWKKLAEYLVDVL